MLARDATCEEDSAHALRHVAKREEVGTAQDACALALAAVLDACAACRALAHAAPWQLSRKLRERVRACARALAEDEEKRAQREPHRNARLDRPQIAPKRLALARRAARAALTLRSMLLSPSEDAQAAEDAAEAVASAWRPVAAVDAELRCVDDLAQREIGALAFDALVGAACNLVPPFWRNLLPSARRLCGVPFSLSLSLSLSRARRWNTQGFLFVRWTRYALDACA